jgi:hypothetical protein
MKKTTKMVLAYTLIAGSLLAGGQAFHMYTSTVQAEQQQSNAQILLQTKDLAKQGKVISSEDFGMGSNKNDIIKKWGPPEGEFDDKWILSYAKKRSIQFGLEGNKVSGMNTSDKNLTSITYNEVQKVLGKGVLHKDMGDMFEVSYQVGKNTLVFTFPVLDNKNPEVFGVSVREKYQEEEITL